MKLVWATVTEVVSQRPGMQELLVELDDAREGRAISFTALTPECCAGDRVLLNSTAVDLGLGTGGFHYVVAHGAPESGVAVDNPSGGHIMKARYTPLQVDVMAVESPESEHHETMADAVDVGGMPVVCCGLHSQVPLVAAAIKHMKPDATVAYCMTDHAALPIVVSNLVARAREAGLLDCAITCGQAFGGDLEAVNLHSGLLAARHVARADVAVAAIGPGVAGTGTPFGHGGVAQGEAVNACASIGAIPIACLRISSADLRERHRGVSHHTLTALSRIALAPARVALPQLPAELAAAVDEQLDRAGIWELHERMTALQTWEVPPPMRGVEVTTMGRGPTDDPAFFAAAFASGEIACRCLPSVLE